MLLELLVSPIGQLDTTNALSQSAIGDIWSIEHLVLRNHFRLIRKFLEKLLSEFHFPSMLLNNWSEFEVA